MHGKRIEWLDAARGLAILLVIVGHADGWLRGSTPEAVTRGIIYSFHMPLFFILAGYTLHVEEPLGSFFRKSCKRLLLPAAVLFVIRFAGKMYYLDRGDFLGGLKSLIWGVFLGWGAGLQFLGVRFPVIGMCWFLIVLFLSRILVRFIL